MLRQAPSKLFAELSVAARNGSTPLIYYQNVRTKMSYTNRARPHMHQTYSKVGNSKTRREIVDLNLLKRGEPVTPTLNIGDMETARKFKFNTGSVNSRGFLRLQKPFSLPVNPAEKMLGACLSCVISRNYHQTLMERVTWDSKSNARLPGKTIDGYQRGIMNSLMRMISTKGGDSVKSTVTPASSAVSPKPQTARKAPSSSNVLGKKRSKMKGTSNTTIMDEYGYNYDEEDGFPITAYAVCDEFDLKAMHKGLIAQGLYIPTVLLDDLSDVIHVSAKYPIGNEPREIFFFREGAVVFWNVPYLEIVNVMKFLKEYQEESYDQEAIEDECEYMNYVHNEQGSTKLIRGRVFLGPDSSSTLLEKYAFANALASSVKLGIWEATLEKYVEGIEAITDALKRAEEIKLSRAEVMQKTGELFALRHQLNLNSDLLDTPDFYWEREKLETLYQKTCDYLSINRRTKVMNEKLNQCCELLDLISSHLTDQHHTRLEWMIIVLIMIEVGFEILHLLERYELIHS